MTIKNYLVIDIKYCHDCNNCFIACKDEHYGNSWLPYTDEQPRHGHRWRNIQRKERGQYPRVNANFLPMPCLHCEEPTCQKAFPNLVTKREDGIVLIDAVKAKGEKGLVDACPYGAIYWNDEKDIAQKCTFCAHIIDGKASATISAPRCAHSCPTGATQYYKEDEADFAKRIEAEDLRRYRPEVSAKGQVYYKNLYKFTKNFIAGGLLKDGDCAEGVKVSLKGSDAPEQTTNYFGDFWFDDLAPGTYTIVADGKEVLEVTIETSKNVGSINI
jgi:Fe-S-cluster-containing dehydrogenase component